MLKTVFIKFSYIQSVTNTFGIYQQADFVVVKTSFIKFSGTHSATNTHIIYQLAQFFLLKSAFIKFLIISQQLIQSEFTY